MRKTVSIADTVLKKYQETSEKQYENERNDWRRSRAVTMSKYFRKCRLTSQTEITGFERYSRRAAMVTRPHHLNSLYHGPVCRGAFFQKGILRRPTTTFPLVVPQNVARPTGRCGMAVWALKGVVAWRPSSRSRFTIGLAKNTDYAQLERI
jgi:hypothetical protein